MDRSTMSLAAGCVCFPSSWNLQESIGKPVHQIHDLVPDLNPSIGERIKRFLEGLQPGRAFCRENWSLTRSDERNYHPRLKRQKLDETVTLDELHLRLEHQLFTALPSGVLMGIRISTIPLPALSEQREEWNNLKEKIRTMPPEVARYKSMEKAQLTIQRIMNSVRCD